jgi:hypothetical protein
VLDTADMGLLALILFVLAAFYVYNKILLSKDAAAVQKYKLYAVRDALTYLVAEGKLSEDEFLFQMFYAVTNHLIKTTRKSLSLRAFLQSVLILEQQGRDPATGELLPHVMEEIKHKDADVAFAIFGFFTTVNDILRENSLIIRLFHRWPALRRVVQRLLKFKRITRLPQVKAYRVYQRYDRANELLHAA